MGLLEAKKRLQEEQRLLHGCNEHQYFNKRSMKCFKRPVRVDRGLPRKSKVVQNPGFLSERCPSPLFKNRQTHRCVKSLPKKYLDAGLLQAEDCPEGFFFRSDKKRCYKNRTARAKKVKVYRAKTPDRTKTPSPSLVRAKSASPSPVRAKSPSPHEGKKEKFEKLIEWLEDPRNAPHEKPEEYDLHHSPEQGFFFPALNMTLTDEEHARYDKAAKAFFLNKSHYKDLKKFVDLKRIDWDHPTHVYNTTVKDYLAKKNL